MTTITITDQSTINAIQTAYNGGDWQTAYTLVFNAISTETSVPDENGGVVDQINPAEGVDPAVWMWVAGARNVNSHTGAFADYIWNYTKDQYFLRAGQNLTDDQVQAASDSIAQRFIADMFGKLPSPTDPNSILPDVITGDFTSLALPDLSAIGQIDAGAAAARIFEQTTASGSDPNYSPWAGTLLFTRLNDPQFFQQWVLTTDKNKFKAEAGTYDLATIAQTTSMLGGWGFLLNVLFSGEFDTALQVEALGAPAVATETAAADTFFDQVYGLSPGMINIGEDIFSQQLLPNSAKYIVGTTGSDAALQSVDGSEFLNAGRGDDTIVGAYNVFASGQTAVIDGAEGTDEIDYSNVSVAISANFENVGQLGVRAAVQKNPGVSTDNEYVYEVEKYKFGSGADTVTVTAGADLSSIEMLDGGDQPTSGKDILDLTSYTHKLSIVNGHVVGDGVDIEVDNFEEVKLPGFGDDDVIRTSGVSTLYAGDGDDVVSVSVPGNYGDSALN